MLWLDAKSQNASRCGLMRTEIEWRLGILRTDLRNVQRAIGPSSELHNNTICTSDILRLNIMVLWAGTKNVGVMSSLAENQKPTSGATAFC